MEFYVYAKGEMKGGHEIEGILSSYYKLPNDLVKRLGGKKKALEHLKRQVTNEKIEKDLIPNDQMFSGLKVTSFELVSVSNGKWINGEYYAHEYDEYCEGRGRKVKYSNGYEEYEIQCLDSDKSVLDGMWDKDDIGSSRIGNGCGDHFTPFERGLF
jgi:hypothetical protein